MLLAWRILWVFILGSGLAGLAFGIFEMCVGLFMIGAVVIDWLILNPLRAARKTKLK